MFENFFKKAPINDPENEQKLKEVQEAQARKEALRQEERMANLSEDADAMHKDGDEGDEVEKASPETIH